MSSPHSNRLRLSFDRHRFEFFVVDLLLVQFWHEARRAPPAPPRADMKRPHRRSLVGPYDPVSVAALMISPSAQKVMPSPLGSGRPCRQKMSSSCSSTNEKNSDRSLVFPTPGSPTTATSWMVDSRSALLKELLRRSSSYRVLRIQPLGPTQYQSRSGSWRKELSTKQPAAAFL
jgi:hypothetical protein